MTEKPLEESKNNQEEVSLEYYIQNPTRPSRTDSNGNNWYIFRLFISPKNKVKLDDITKVVYILPSSLDPQKVASANPGSQFAIELEALGGFYVIAFIIFKDGKYQKNGKYLQKGSVLTDPSIISTNPAAYWTDFAMKQAEYFTNIGQEQSKDWSGQGTL